MRWLDYFKSPARLERDALNAPGDYEVIAGGTEEEMEEAKRQAEAEDVARLGFTREHRVVKK